MSKKVTSGKDKKISDDITLSENEDNKSLLLKKKYSHLEQLRDYIYKDVVLADSKSGFALTVVTVSLAASIALFKEPNFFWILGLLFAGLSVFCSMLTILPRSYVTHDMVKNPEHWVNLKSGWINEIVRRYLDAINVIFENLWQKQSKGTTNSLKLLLKSYTDAEVVDTLYISMQRAFLAQTLKYLWVGKALLFAYLTFCFMGLSLLLTIDKTTKINTSTKKTSAIKIDSAQRDSQTVIKKDSVKFGEKYDSIEKKDKLLARNELAEGRAIQIRSLPEPNPNIPGWDAWLFLQPSNDVGGDLIDCIRPNENHHILVLGDVSGKGLSAALLMVKLQTAIRTLLSEEILLPELCSRINQIFYREGFTRNFATLVVLDIHSESGKIQLLNAGHTPPILIRKGQLLATAEGNPPLGLMSKTGYNVVDIILQKGDVLMVYSNGINLIQNKQGDLFRNDRLSTLITNLHNLPTAKIGGKIIKALRSFSGKSCPDDDQTFLILKYIGQ